MITLTTDFGLQDHYVGTMKGVVLRCCPHAQIVDISHGVRLFSVISGAYTIAQAAPYFPPAAIHVVVVDPGVGTARRAIAAKAGGQTFIAPDNGVLSLILKPAKAAEVREIVNEKLFQLPVSSTFHGRDIFAPVAAALEAGEDFKSVGPLISDVVLLSLEPKEIGAGNWRGLVLSVDQFGNIITNLRWDRFRNGELAVRGVPIRGRYQTFGEAPPREVFVYEGSSGFLELGINRGRAAERLQMEPGDAVDFSPAR